MSDRWSATQVSAVAPDASSLSAARSLAKASKWLELGHAEGDPPSLWGLCKGSGAKPYQTCVDLAEPAFRCSCPSRKFPCKHALGLLLLWSSGSVDEAELPVWVKEWHEGRAARAAKARKPRADTPATAAPSPERERAAARRGAQREERVAAGLNELDQWLCDQVRNGIAGADQAGYGHWDTMAARLVDAQATTVAGEVRRLAGVTGRRDDWPGHLLAELSLLRLLARGYSRIDTLPAPLAATVRARVGFTVPAEQVLATDPVRDRWQVLGVRDEAEERLTTRRVWLLGAQTQRRALVLSFGGFGQALPADLVVGTLVDASLCFFPGALPLRALVAEKHAAPTQLAEAPPAGGVDAALAGYAHALAAEPWLTNWPVVVRGVFAPGSPWYFVDQDGAALPLAHSVEEPWAMYAAGGGEPTVLAAEWTPAGLRPLTLFTTTEVVLA